MKKLKSFKWIPLMVIFAIIAGSCLQAAGRKSTLQLGWVFQGEWVGYLVGVSKGYYTDEGINLTVLPGGPDLQPVRMVASGDIEFGTAWPSAVMSIRAQGVPIVLIYQGPQDSVMVYIAKKERGITDLAHIMGKTFGVWVGFVDFEAKAMLSKANLDPNNVEWYPQKFSMVEFYENRIDVASATTHNELHIVLDAGYSLNDLTVFRASDVGANLIADGIIVSEDLIKEEPDLIQGFVNATARGWKYACTNPEEATNIILDWAPDLDRRKQLIQTVETCMLHVSHGAEKHGFGYLDFDDIERVQQILVDTDQLKAPIDLAPAITNKFWKKIPNHYKSVPAGLRTKLEKALP